MISDIWKELGSRNLDVFRHMQAGLMIDTCISVGLMTDTCISVGLMIDTCISVESHYHYFNLENNENLCFN